MHIQPNDRILLLSIPDAELVRELAARAAMGLVVALGEDDSVRAARGVHRELENVMFLPASVEDIPWQGGYFSLIVDFGGERGAAQQAEIARLLAPGGRVETAR